MIGHLNDNFVLLCSLVMIPMIFFVPVMYINSYPDSESDNHLTSMITALLCGIACWIIFGNSESFHFGFSSLSLQSGNPDITLLSQMCFYLYSIVMFTGTVLRNASWKFFVGFIPLWTLLVYAPIANLIWSPTGVLYKMGALDFSGGLVVHLTAGLTSLILSVFMRNNRIKLPKDNQLLNYVATLFILTGWLGFNLAPAGVFSNGGSSIIVNTLVAVIGSVIGWTYSSNLGLSSDAGAVYNGIICGLVTSTALVAYVSTLSMLIVALVSGIICHYMCELLSASDIFHDPVDSFAINGIGGIVGTLGLILFASPIVNKDGAIGLLAGGFNFTGVELLTLLTTTLITLLGTLISLGIVKAIKELKVRTGKEEAF